jgi:hypothetical protein
MSPVHWIQDRLTDFNLRPKNKYFVYKWGIATEDFDPREYGLYRTEKILETIEIKEKQPFFSFI